MRDKEKARNYNFLYRRQHRLAIRIKNRLYKCLSRVREQTRRGRRVYYQAYYQRHREKFLKRVREWAQANPDKTRIYKKAYRRRQRKKKKGFIPKIRRIVEEYLAYCKERHAQDTVRHYRINMGRFLGYLERPGSRSPEYHRRLYQEHRKPTEEQNLSWTQSFCKIHLMDQIDRDLITQYVRYVNHDETNVQGGTLNQSEKESRLYPLKSFLFYCQRRGYTKQDLRKFVVIPPREKKVLKRVLTPEEMERLLSQPKPHKTTGIRDRALLELAYSGFRANEMLHLKTKYVDLTTNAVTVVDGKGRKDRIVPMTTEAILCIQRWLARRLELVKQREDPEYLFITKGLKPLGRRHFSLLLKKYGERAKLPIDISPHDLRRMTATHLAENGAPIRLIQALLGHATLKVTTRYLRLTDEKVKKEHHKTHPSNRRKLYYERLHG